MTYGELLQFGRAELENAKIEDSDFDARELLLGISGLSRTALLMGPDVQAPEEVVSPGDVPIIRSNTSSANGTSTA